MSIQGTLKPHSTYSPKLSIRSSSRDVSYYLGWFLLIALIVQYSLGIQWQRLVELQQDSLYRQVSGFVLASLVYLQWRLAWLRNNVVRERFKNYKQQHKWIGIGGIVFLYLHSVTLGFAYQMLLVVVFLGTITFGLLNPDATNYRKPWFVKAWLIGHVCLALATVLIGIYHLYIVYTFH